MPKFRLLSRINEESRWKVYIYCRGMKRHSQIFRNVECEAFCNCLEITEHQPVFPPTSIILLSIAYVKPGLTNCLISRGIQYLRKSLRTLPQFPEICQFSDKNSFFFTFCHIMHEFHRKNESLISLTQDPFFYPKRASE